MSSKIVMALLSLLGLYHTYTFGAYLAKNGQKKSALSVYALVIAAGALFTVACYVR